MGGNPLAGRNRQSELWAHVERRDHRLRTTVALELTFPSLSLAPPGRPLQSVDYLALAAVSDRPRMAGRALDGGEDALPAQASRTSLAPLTMAFGGLGSARRVDALLALYVDLSRSSAKSTPTSLRASATIATLL